MTLPGTRFLTNSTNSYLQSSETSYFSPKVAAVPKPKPIQHFRKSGAEIEVSLNSILHSVHNNLRAKQYKNLTTKKIPPVIGDIESPASSSNVGKSQLANRRQKNNNSSNVNLKLTQSPKLGNNQMACNMGLVQNSLSTMRTVKNNEVCNAKANYQQKRHLRMRRHIPGPGETNNFATQKRIREVLRQKRILEDMLNAHKKLQRDRESIQAELIRMRTYLNDIRNQLDKSLYKINSSKTISATLKAPSTHSSITSNSSGRTQLSSSSARSFKKNVITKLPAACATKNAQQRVIPVGKRRVAKN